MEKVGIFHFYVSLLEGIISKGNICRIYLQKKSRLGCFLFVEICLWKKIMVGGGSLQIFFMFTPKFWGNDDPIGLSHIFFNWVGKQPPTRMGVSGFLRKDDLENSRGLPNGWNFSFLSILTCFFAFSRWVMLSIHFLLLHYICTWNPHDPCFGWKRPSFRGLEPQK